MLNAAVVLALRIPAILPAVLLQASALALSVTSSPVFPAEFLVNFPTARESRRACALLLALGPGAIAMATQAIQCRRRWTGTWLLRLTVFVVTAMQLAFFRVSAQSPVTRISRAAQPHVKFVPVRQLFKHLQAFWNTVNIACHQSLLPLTVAPGLHTHARVALEGRLCGDWDRAGSAGVIAHVPRAAGEVAYF